VRLVFRKDSDIMGRLSETSFVCIICEHSVSSVYIYDISNVSSIEL